MIEFVEGDAKPRLTLVRDMQPGQTGIARYAESMCDGRPIACFTDNANNSTRIAYLDNGGIWNRSTEGIFDTYQVELCDFELRRKS
jgi:hypothetical protein